MATLALEIANPRLDSKGIEEHSSLVNLLIPGAIKRRAGRLLSIRKALSFSVTSDSTSLSPPSPPPPYVDSLVVKQLDEPQGISSDCSLDGEQSSDWDFGDAGDVSKSGIRWKYVSEGSRLVRLARREAREDQEDPELTRKMYIDGVGYLLKGLPNLSTDEIAQSSRYLPQSLKCTDQHHRNEDEVREPKPDEENYIYRLVALITMYSVLFIALILPVLRRLAAAVYRCDQRYHVSNRVAQSTTQTLSAWAQTILRSLNEGRAGQALLGLTLYTMEGASKGFFDGYSLALKRQDAALRHSEEREQHFQLKGWRVTPQKGSASS